MLALNEQLDVVLEHPIRSAIPLFRHVLNSDRIAWGWVVDHATLEADTSERRRHVLNVRRQPSPTTRIDFLQMRAFSMSAMIDCGQVVDELHVLWSTSAIVVRWISRLAPANARASTIVRYEGCVSDVRTLAGRKQCAVLTSDPSSLAHQDLQAR